MLTVTFARAAVERAAKTFFQTLAALLVADGSDLLGTNWGDRLSVAGMAAVVSLLTSLASGPLDGPGPSVGGEVLAPSGEHRRTDDGRVEVREAVIALVVLVAILVVLALFGHPKSW